MKFKNNEVFEKAKSIPIRDIILYYGIEIKNDKICCLYHNDTRPSAHIYDEDNWVKCFSCDKGIFGGIDIVMIKEGYSFKQAINFLSNNFIANENYVDNKEKVKYDLYFNINDDIRKLIISNKNKNILLKYSQLIDLNNRNERVMLRLYGKMMELINREAI